MALAAENEKTGKASLRPGMDRSAAFPVLAS
jgi:hypothetical protein